MDLSGHQGEIPIPITTTYIPSTHATSHTHGHSMLHHTTPSNAVTSSPANANNNNGTPHSAAEDHDSPPRQDAATVVAPLSISKKHMMVKYKECLKNHAASIGGNATDGCGEFMPSGPDGTIEALKCSACGCHRNFHRKEVEGDPYASSCHCKGTPYIYSPAGRSSISVRPALPALTHHPHHQMVMPLSAMQTSESDEMEGVGGTPGMMGSNPAMGHHTSPMPMSGMGSVRSSSGKKRFRTKFTSEQKERMLNFAEKVGWRLQRLEDGVVQQFCQEIGVKRRVLKVWMHNNKHSLAKKISPDEQQQQPPPQLQLE